MPPRPRAPVPGQGGQGLPDPAAYGQPAPGGPPYGPGGPPYGPADPELTAFEAESRRRFTWLAVASGLGLVLSIAALILAIGAGNQSADDERIADAVKRESRNTAREIERQLRDETARANDVLDELESGTKTAREAGAAAEKAVEETNADVEKNADDIAKLQETVDGLGSKVDALPDDVSGLGDVSTSVDTLKSQVEQLMQDVSNLQGAGGDGGTP